MPVSMAGAYGLRLHPHSNVRVMTRGDHDTGNGLKDPVTRRVTSSIRVIAMQFLHLDPTAGHYIQCNNGLL